MTKMIGMRLRAPLVRYSLVSTRLASTSQAPPNTEMTETPKTQLIEEKAKPRKTYKVMRKVNPAEFVLSPEQWKHMRHQTLIQHSRWIYQGGWKKKVAVFSIIFAAVGYIFSFTILKMSRDSFYAELELAEHHDRLKRGAVAKNYNLDALDD